VEEKMLREMADVVQEGQRNGNHMIIRMRLPSGLEILGLPTENAYGGDWDLGPTWNYLVLADRPFLVDTGRTGQGVKILEKMEAAGISSKVLSFVLLSHGHEDHDGGLPEIVGRTGASVKAHAIYDRLIRFYPDQAPPGVNKDFPASCWRCLMPESFSSRHCPDYHRGRSRLRIEAIGDAETALGNGMTTYHLPGHNPDALVLLLDQEVLLVGDTILPDISPHPTRESAYEQVAPILRPQYPQGESIFGLQAYIRSLKKLEEIAAQMPHLIVLPAHRLYYNHQWNDVVLKARVKELMDHHVTRCADILKILKQGPKTAKEVATAHFEPSLLKGFGITMAEHEILSHLELLQISGDIVAAPDGKFEATGTWSVESLIEGLSPEY
jgi:glyoxylase-like metal-dependent hydrolase (beta-lactamase superfamily II)